MDVGVGNAMERLREVGQQADKGAISMREEKVSVRSY